MVMDRTKGILKHVCTLMLMLVMLAVFYAVSVNAEIYSDTKQIGKYYFKYNYDNERLYISKHKNKGFTKTVIDTEYFASNGKQVLYMDRSGGKYYIKSYDIAKKKVKKIKKLPDKYYWRVDAAAGGYIWVSDSENLYRYEVSADKLERVKKNITLFRQIKDSYYLMQTGEEKTYKKIKTSYGTEYVIYEKLSIARITKSGKIKVIKSLGKVYGYSIDYLRKTPRIYYSASNAHKVYRMDINGKKKKLLSSADGYFTCPMEKFSSYVENGTSYLYYYKSKKLIKSN